jgi:hypothetical protein
LLMRERGAGSMTCLGSGVATTAGMHDREIYKLQT